MITKQFIIRDILWLFMVISVGFSAYRWGVDNENKRIAGEIRANGFYDDRGFQAVLFPIRDDKGKQDGRMVRFYTKPNQDGTYTAEAHYDFGFVQPYFLPISE